MEITGKIVAKPAPKSGATWKKVFIVVQYEDGQYPKSIILSNMNKAEDFERLRVGDSGTFKFDGKVRQSGDTYYMDLNCWSWKVDTGYGNGPI